jgi:hypothetical protein
MVRRQRKIVEQFQAAGATSADRATTAAALGVDEGMAFKQLRRHAILQEVGEQRLFVDTARWAAHRQRRRRRALIATTTVCIVMGLFFTWAIVWRPWG